MADPSPFGLVYDPRFLLHDTGMIHATLPDGSVLEAAEHPSSARIIRRIHALLEGSGLAQRFTPIPTREASREEVLAFHTPGYLGRLEALSRAGSGDAGESAPVSPGSWEAALLAAGSTIAAVDAVLDGAAPRAYVLARPPGHHAVADMGMGFCLLNNVALAALHARRRGVARVLILDWDVHHGNGTQAAFYHDPSVLFISLHQEDWYPIGMGSLDQRGAGDGVGATVNVPLPAGTGDRGYAAVLDRIVAPVARRFQPNLIFVSAGQDASMMDPLGRMLVSMAGFRAMGLRVRALADELCDGRLVLVQEGGYSEVYTPFSTLGALEGASGFTTGIADPYLDQSELARAEAVYSRDTDLAIEAAERVHVETA
ncbi:MAG TPA: class II histone deacetylase [Chloroflexota bacterium]|nr:class II histone deacetylase [Chloroflexota bacterium]